MMMLLVPSIDAPLATQLMRIFRLIHVLQVIAAASLLVYLTVDAASSGPDQRCLSCLNDDGHAY